MWTVPVPPSNQDTTPEISHDTRVTVTSGRIPDRAMIDPSTSDLAARVLELFGTLHAPATHPTVSRALDYVSSEQQPDGSWFGRWGVNYLYGTWQERVHDAVIRSFCQNHFSFGIQHSCVIECSCGNGIALNNADLLARSQNGISNHRLDGQVNGITSFRLEMDHAEGFQGIRDGATLICMGHVVSPK